MVAIHHLEFLKSRNYILSDRMQRAEMDQRALFRQNRSNGFWDHFWDHIFNFSRWQWPPSWIFKNV